MEQIILQYLGKVTDGNPYLVGAVIIIIFYVKSRFREITGWNKRQDRDIEKVRNDYNDRIIELEKRIYDLAKK